VDDAARCPHCGALVTPDAEWCGQCFRSLRPEPEPATGADAASGPGTEASSSAPVAVVAEPGTSEAGATWPCPTCGSFNPIELDVCAVCGTSFAQLLRTQEEGPRASPRDAFLWSLIYPGVGHAKVGRPADGIARGTLFALTFGLALVIVLSGVSNAAIFGVVAVLLVSAIVLYLGSALEAYRIAEGGSPFLSARALLWATVAVIMVSVSLLALSVIGVAQR
jgi:ribosomal protein L40E